MSKKIQKKAGKSPPRRPTSRNRTETLRPALEKALRRMPKAKPAKRAQGVGTVSAGNLRGKVRLPETEDGNSAFRIPFPKDLAHLDGMSPLVIRWHYEMEYLHSYAQDSPFFAGLANGRLLGTRCIHCRYTFATPKGHCMRCGEKTRWIELPLKGKVHSWTTCYFGSQEFLKETPFNLVLVEFEGADTLLLSRLVGVGQDGIAVGMEVKAQFRRNAKLLASDVYFVPA